jgi:2-succinyl-5-enolpyruvyl-6-hydroxy-3-cyclohexene-1-carboxylate synthase
MKTSINRNTFISELFVKHLSLLGVGHVCISPGSRSTPLTLAFAENRKFKSYIHIDERSSAFFALGLAKATCKPVVLVSTSGTAAVEFYPAIVEAYQQRVPLIICTADRPPEQRGRGANQTINQINLYANHILLYIDAGLPIPNKKGIKKIISIASTAVEKANSESGPIHINFPFKKPFESFNFTDTTDEEIVLFANNITQPVIRRKKSTPTAVKKANEIINHIRKVKKGIIIAGPDKPDKEFRKYCLSFSEITGFPVLADVNSNLRTGRVKKSNIITTYDVLFRSESLMKRIKPELIIQFNRTPTSRILLDYLNKSDCRRININKFGDWFDPSRKAEAAVAYNPSDFCKAAIKGLKGKEKDEEWIKLFVEAETSADNIRRDFIKGAPFNFEGGLITKIIEAVPENTSIMISNSTPVRDLDNFTPAIKKNLTIYSNRGASGIDGIISTASGITAGLKKPVILITGDLAFLYDITALTGANKYKIPLTIILINNNGGGIFNALPVSAYKKIFNKFFITPHNLEFSHLIRSFGCDYKLIKGENDLKEELSILNKSSSASVLEIKTNAEESFKVRNLFHRKADAELSRILYKKTTEIK